jgi:CRP-like cAMP-binding protein
MTSTTNLSTGLTAGRRERLMRVAREVSFDTGTRIFEEGRRADRFWIVRTGNEFDAEAVRAMCAGDPEFGRAIADWVGRVVAHRLHASRNRLHDLYAPYGSGSRM